MHHTSRVVLIGITRPQHRRNFFAFFPRARLLHWLGQLGWSVPFHSFNSATMDQFFPRFSTFLLCPVPPALLHTRFKLIVTTPCVGCPIRPLRWFLPIFFSAHRYPCFPWKRTWIGLCWEAFRVNSLSSNCARGGFVFSCCTPVMVVSQ